jgi:hypothetical protein
MQKQLARPRRYEFVVASGQCVLFGITGCVFNCGLDDSAGLGMCRCLRLSTKDGIADLHCDCAMMKLFFREPSGGHDVRQQKVLVACRVTHSCEGFRSLSMRYEGVEADTFVIYDPSREPAPRTKVTPSTASCNDLDTMMRDGLSNVTCTERKPNRCELDMFVLFTSLFSDLHLV